MKATKPQVQILPQRETPMTPTAFAQHSLGVVALHGERILAEVPRVVRRASLLLLVLSVSIPVFFAGLLVVLWHLAQ